MRRGYQFKNGQCWGYNCRPVRGSTTTPSNHSWGLALDFNSVYNWLGRTDGGDIPVWMRDLWKAYGFRWGGDFSGRKDPMHFEYMGTRSSVDSQMAKFNRMRAEQAERELEEADDMKFEQFREGWEAYMEGKDVKAVWSNEKKFGWRAARFAAKNPRPEQPTP